MRDRSTHWLVLTLLLALAQPACEEDQILVSTVPAKTLLRYYHAMSTNHATTYVTATFYTDAGFDVQNNPWGKHVTLDGKASIALNGAPLQYNEPGMLSGTTYTLKLKDWPQRFTFTYTDPQGKKHVDKVTMDRIDAGADFFKSSSTGDVVVWEGSPVRQGETVDVSLGSTDTNLHYQTRQVGARRIAVPGLPPGYDWKLFKQIDISRTLRKRLHKALMDDDEYGVYIKLVYQVNEF